MVTKKTWQEFRDSGMLWWINRLLHTFGWAIVVDVDDDKEIGAYPARVKYRGFPEMTEEDGYIKVSRFMRENAEELEKESKE